MKWGAKLGIMVVVVMLVLPMVYTSKATYEGKKIPVNVSTIHPMGSKEMTVMISEKDLKRIEKKYVEAGAALELLASVTDEEEREEVIKPIKELLYELKDLHLIPSFININHFIWALLAPKFDIVLPIISFGRGFSWIPLYPGEAFIGFMFRPIFVQYFLLGYTASLNIKLLPPRLEYWDMVGTHTLVILGFVGIYIDFGKIGYGIPKMQLLLGESLMAGGFDWL